MDEVKRDIYSFDEFEVDAVERTVTRNGKTVVLSNRTFDLLLVLIKNRGHLLTKNDLINKVWEGQFVEESNLTVQISALRRALGENKNNPQYLITVQGRGYRFVANVITLAEKEISDQSEKLKPGNDGENNESLAVAELPTISKPKISRSFIKNWRVLAVIGLILASALIFGGYFWRNAKTTIFAASLKLSLKRLTANGKIATASISPDGKFFIYSQTQDSKTGLWLGQIDGGEPIQLRPPEDGVSYQSVNFTADGGSFYYVLTDARHPQGELYKSQLFGGVPVELRENVSKITYSPDGKQIAYVRNDEKNDKSSLIISEIDSTAERPLIVRPFARHFSPQSLAWSVNGLLISVGAIANNGQDYEIYIVNVSDGSAKQLTDSNWGAVHSMTWLKDDNSLVIVADGKDINSATWQLYQVLYPSETIQQLNSDLSAYGSSLSLSSDNKTLLTVQAQLVGNMWVAPADDLSKAKQVTFGSPGRLDGWHGLDWTPDGKIIYTGTIGNSRTIWMMDADGNNQKQIIPNGGTNLYPSVTSDGRFLVFQSNRSGKYAVWRANIDGSDMRQLTETDVAAQPHVSPDGKWIVYISNLETFGTMYRISIDGGQPLRLTDKRAEWLHISPDSQFIAFGYDDNGKEKLALISINGGETVKIFDVPKSANFRLGVHWTPDGKSVTYRDSTNGIWKQNLQGGEPEKLVGLPSEKIYAYSWSRDGNLFAFTRGSEIRDAILFTNFR